MSAPLYTIPLTRIDGSPSSLADHEDQVLLIVNVASKCGLTPQYEGLEALYRGYKDRGFAVLGFPANDFGSQEPGSNAEIAAFCRSIYGVDFPMFGKITVKGPDKHPLYKALIEAQPVQTVKPGSDFAGRPASASGESEVLWNFEKFLVDRSGKVVGRFAPDTLPDDPMLVRAIETALQTPTDQTNN